MDEPVGKDFLRVPDAHTNRVAREPLSWIDEHVLLDFSLLQTEMLLHILDGLNLRLRHRKQQAISAGPERGHPESVDADFKADVNRRRVSR